MALFGPTDVAQVVDQAQAQDSQARQQAAAGQPQLLRTLYGPGNPANPGPSTPANVVWRSWVPHAQETDNQYFWLWIGGSETDSDLDLLNLPKPPKGQYWDRKPWAWPDDPGGIVWFTVNGDPLGDYAAPDGTRWIANPGPNPAGAAFTAVLLYDGGQAITDSNQLPSELYPYKGPAGVYSEFASPAFTNPPLPGQSYWTQAGGHWITVYPGIGTIIEAAFVQGIGGGFTAASNLVNAAQGNYSGQQTVTADPGKALVQEVKGIGELASGHIAAGVGDLTTVGASGTAATPSPAPAPSSSTKSKQPPTFGSGATYALIAAALLAVVLYFALDDK
jgi:hypothetical protein